MGIIESVEGPRSKKETHLPYTFEARVDILGGHGREPVFNHYYSCTICGLIGHLERLGLFPGDVELYSVFRGCQDRLSKELFTAADGSWIKRPELCGVLEEHFRITKDECYRGHVGEGPCAFDDRDRECFGPTS